MPRYASVFLILALTACSGTGPTDVPLLEDVAQPTSQTGRYRDPFTYCAAVGTIDAPDAPYIGPKVPESVARGLRDAFDAPAGASLNPFFFNSVWRCMDGKVYACNTGSNLPCDGKADTSRTPNQAMRDFCQKNPDSDYIPFAITGRTTVYQWRCTSGEPTIVEQYTEPDARGYLSNIWHPISPPS